MNISTALCGEQTIIPAIIAFPRGSLPVIPPLHTPLAPGRPASGRPAIPAQGLLHSPIRDYNSMKASDDLHKLIASLTKAEKRYCRLHIEKGAGRDATRSLKLFDAVAALPAYGEEALRRKLAGTIQPAHLPAAKNYLYASVLRALRAFNSRKLIRTQVRELIESAYVLINKGLLEQGEKMTAKAKRMARAHDLFEAELEVKRLEWSVSFHRLHADLSPENLEAYHTDLNGILERGRNYWEFKRLMTAMSRMMVMEAKPRTPGERKVYDDLMSHPLLSSESNALGQNARQIYFDLHRIYHLMTCNYQAGYAHSLKHIRMYQELEEMNNPNPIDHATIVYTHLCICVKLGKLEEAGAAYREVIRIGEEAGFRSVSLQRLAYESAISLHLAQGDYRKVAALGTEAERFLESNTDTSLRQARVAMRFYIAVACFLTEDYRRAAEMLHPVLNNPDREIRPDLQSLARLLKLMIHLEAGDIDFLPYLWRSAYRHLCRNGGPHQLERAILDFMRRMPEARSASEMKRAFQEFKRKIETLAANPDQTETAIALNILPWLERKLGNEPPAGSHATEALTGTHAIEQARLKLAAASLPPGR